MATYGPEVIMQNNDLTHQTKLSLLYLLLPLVDVYRDNFVRRCNENKSAKRVYLETLLLGGNEQDARVKEAWQKINLSRE